MSIYSGDVVSKDVLKDDFSTGLIPDYIVLPANPRQPIILCFAAKEKFYRHSLVTTFFHLVTAKKFRSPVGVCRKKLISDPEGRCKERGRMHSTEKTICSFDRRR